MKPTTKRAIATAVSSVLLFAMGSNTASYVKNGGSKIGAGVMIAIAGLLILKIALDAYYEGKER